jgi:hypothetical protein
MSEPTQVPQPIVEPIISVESITKKIKALLILADMGDEKALRKVKALKTLI